MSQKRDLGETVVLHAAGSCNDRVLKNLLDAGGSANATDGDQTALVSAILGSRHRNVAVLVQYGADVNLSSPRGSPLFVTVLENNVDDLSFLLAHRADPNGVDEARTSPLMLAAGLGNMEVIHVLLRAGAKIDLCNSDGDTALTWAAREDKVRALVALLAAGADPTLHNHAGKNAEHAALGSGVKETARLLHYYHRNPPSR